MWGGKHHERIVEGRRPRSRMEGHTGDEGVLPGGRSRDGAQRRGVGGLIPGHNRDTARKMQKRRRSRKPCGAFCWGVVATGLEPVTPTM